ncbi:ABC transporter permease [Methanospirillum stamsii]|uniref:Molybdate ABC transporter permease subunit n=1 Tax=Methanospirillum stamsii TaxID=1277351 RepID=A0A2V2NHZ4_9EURY|nr:ABC transporter permease [Methanospirillum stamsii]PWR76037.1 molybdate ABC transporter permease subunit [Methanospirillum stamsii]
MKRIFRVLSFSWFKGSLIFLSGALIFFFCLVFAGLILWPEPRALFEALASEEIRFAIELSLITSLISTMLCAAIALPVAYALSRYQFVSSRLMGLIISLPLSLPPLVAGIALLIFFGPSVFGQLIQATGIDIVYTTSAIIIAQFFVNVPYLIRVMRSAFDSVNPRYEYVARTLGASEPGVFFQVSLPMSKQALLAGLTITWSKAMGEFGAVLMLAGATKMKTETLPIALYLNISTGDLDMAIASATILLAISVGTLVIFEYFFGSRRIL